MDFSQVKAITIPEGSVTKIEDSQGNVLWSSGPSWHTEWEGIQLIQGSNASTSSVSSMWTCTLPEYIAVGNTRITLDYDITWLQQSSSYYMQYYDDTLTSNMIHGNDGGATVTGTVTTYIRTISTTNNSFAIMNALASGGVTDQGVRLFIRTQASSNTKVLNFLGRKWTAGGNPPTTNITIKKIEQLY